ncbi:MAG: histidine phosphatase family protein [Pseudomonadota bacterium]
MLLHMVRHGATTEPGMLIGRRTDVPATADGNAAVIRQLTALQPKTLLSSPMQRCVMAAELAGSQLGVSVCIDPAWSEYDFGDWDGVRAGELRQRYGRDLDDFYANPERNQPPNGEAWSTFSARLEHVLRSSNTQRLREPIAVVTHAGVMRGALRIACGFTFADAWAVRIHHGTMLSLHYGRDGHDRLWGSIEALRPA